MLNGTPKILVTSRGRSGSWAIRGEQLGNRIGATVQVNANVVKGYDAAIIVKRPRADLLHRLRTIGVPIIWDVVDAWPQPEGNSWGHEKCLDWLRSEVKEIKPIAIVAATKAMEQDCQEFGVPVLCLPHHARPGQRVNPVREKVQAIGYEGGAHYLGEWKEHLERESAKRYWRFLVNPASLCDLDIVIAVRHFNGYATKHWKSNVKLANAQGSGTPCVMNIERGYVETERGGVYWIDEPSELPTAFEYLTQHAVRKDASEKLLASQIRIEDCAEKYKAWLHRLKF